MILSLALTLSLVPQEPAPAGLFAHLESLDLTAHAEDLVQRFARASRVRSRIQSPAFLQQLRAGGEPLVDPALDLVNGSGDEAMGLEQAQDLVERMLGVSRRRTVPGRAMDPRRFRSLLQQVHRDLRRALGRMVSEPHETRPRLQSALERMWETGPGHRTLPAEDLRHVETVDQAELQRLCRVIVQAAMGLQRPEMLKRLRNQATRRVYRDVVGDVLWDWETTFGRFVVGGYGPNTYDCTQIDVIVDLGGDDVYRGPAGATTDLRSLGVVVDVEGNDRYEALNDGLGSATQGIGILLDMAGDDRYSARARSAGFGMAGLGMLADLEGDDVLELGHHSGGVGLAGVGYCLDLAGDDQQTAAGESFALGLPGGFGMFLDSSGNDRRELGSPMVDDVRGSLDLSLGLGAGVGLHDELQGGVGLFLDCEGDDEYRSGSLTLGAGAQGGLGMFFDLSGDDTYRAGSGSQGMAHDFGKALFFEGAGNDDHSVDGGFGLGAASHGGEAWFVEVGGDDVYRVEGIGLGEARTPGIAGFLDLDGIDRYLKHGDGTPWPARGPRPEIEGALSLFLDDGGTGNRYAWDANLTPRRGEQVRQQTPDGRQVAWIVLVDR